MPSSCLVSPLSVSINLSHSPRINNKTGYIIYEPQCKVKTWSFCSKIIKNFQTLTAEHGALLSTGPSVAWATRSWSDPRSKNPSLTINLFFLPFLKSILFVYNPFFILTAYYLCQLISMTICVCSIFVGSSSSCCCCVLCCAQMQSCVWFFVIPWAVTCQAPLSMGFFQQEYWSGLPFPTPGDLPDSGIEPTSLAWQADSFTTAPPGKPPSCY